MRRRHADLAAEDRPPAMFVGDEGLAAEPKAVVPPWAAGAAAPLPQELSVVIEGPGFGRLLVVAAGLLGAAALGVLATEGVFGPAGRVLFAGTACAVLAWLAHRDLLRHRREFRLVEDGIVVRVWPLAGGGPREMHVRWAEIADYTVSTDHEKAFLQAASTRGYTFTLRDRHPSGPATREFVRRFLEEAERHPRAAEPRARGGPLPDITGERPPVIGRVLALLAFAVIGGYAEAYLGWSFTQEMAGLAVVGVIFIGVALWIDLDDPEIAGKDANSSGLTARLRRWLRRVLRIRAS